MKHFNNIIFKEKKSDKKIDSDDGKLDGMFVGSKPSIGTDKLG